MTDYLTLAKELSRKRCLTVGNAHQTLANIIQEVIEAERADCAAVCDEYSMNHGTGMFDKASAACADAIRARGKTRASAIETN